WVRREEEAWGSDVKEVQDLLGDVHDLDVLWTAATQINAFANEESRARWQQIVREARDKRIARYRERMLGPASLWRVWRKELPAGGAIEGGGGGGIGVWGVILAPPLWGFRAVAGVPAPRSRGRGAE